jgi:uncharacterized coiled-coil DUF342 family protein
LFRRKQARQEAVRKAREGFASWLEISRSPGWKRYQEKIEKRMAIIRNKFENDTTLTPEDLKRLQLAYQVWKEVNRIPKELEEDAKGGK